MKIIKYLTAFMVYLFMTTAAWSQIQIILDTDFGGDADDLGALAMLHHLMDRGECELLAVMSWSTEQFAVSAIDAVNRYYDHPDIAIGVRDGDIYHDDWNYTKVLADRFHHERTHRDVPDATTLYRRLLSGGADSSIVIITIGPLMNIQNLIQSQADSLSPLTGRELIEKKVKEFVIMGGQFPEGEREWNFDGYMPGVTQFVLENLTVPVTFSGFEVGDAIKTGEIINELEPETPLYVGFMHFSRNAPWMKEQFKGRILDNSSYDQTAVLYAVRKGTGIYWDKIKGGYCQPDARGGNRWIPGEMTNHSYLKLTMAPEEMALLIESIMLGAFTAIFGEPEPDLTETWHFEGRGAVRIIDEKLVLQDSGAGVVLWTRKDFPGDILLEFDLSFSNNRGIGVFFIAAQGKDGEDILKELPPRTGEYEQYINGDIDCYGFSLHRFFPDGRHNPGTNIRKNSGFNLVSHIEPDPVINAQQTYRIRIMKKGRHLRLWVDNDLIHDWKDDETFGPVHNDGKIGFRLRGHPSCNMHLDKILISPL